MNLFELFIKEKESGDSFHHQINLHISTLERVPANKFKHIVYSIDGAMAIISPIGAIAAAAPGIKTALMM